jgi:threonylcarbamoyladenosine tRNA methylthiotransferase MtaB
MKRRYNTVEFKSLVSKLKKKLPDSAIGADVIVGFPGETNAHFEGTRRFIEGLDIAYLHVFSYSRRTGTAADKMSGQVPEREKKRRADILRKISEEKRAWFVKSQVGKKLRVVIEAKRDKKTGKLKGVSENYIPVLLDGGDEMMKKQVDVKFKMEG